MRRTGPRSSAGFTLIELMIVIAIIGILSAIAIPKFAELLRKSKEGGTKGNLGALRSALTIYYGEMEGFYPVGAWNSNSNVLDSLVPKYLGAIPINRAQPYHPDTFNVFCHWQIAPGDEHDGNGWIYDGYNTPTDANWGMIWVACSHTDSKGSIWTAY